MTRLKPTERSYHLAFLCLGLLAIVLVGAAHANQSDAASPSSQRLAEERFLELASDANAVAVVSLVSHHSYWSASREMIYTQYTLATSTSFHGSVPSTFFIVEEGGEVGEVGLLVSDSVSFETGVDYAILLEPHPAGLYFDVVAGPSGVLQLLEGTATPDAILSRLQTMFNAEEAAGNQQ